MGRAIDLTGRKFGRLTVMERAGYYTTPKGKRFLQWLCKCDCGGFKTVITSKLNNGHTKSCGCLQTEKSETNLNMRENDRFEDTRITTLTCKRYKNNRSGYKGIHYHKRAKKWTAQITIKRKQIWLGQYEKKEDAIKARKEAEEKYFKPIIKEFNEVRKDESIRDIN